MAHTRPGTHLQGSDGGYVERRVGAARVCLAQHNDWEKEEEMNGTQHAWGDAVVPV
jgi:hypothetical protein